MGQQSQKNPSIVKSLPSFFSHLSLFSLSLSPHFLYTTPIIASHSPPSFPNGVQGCVCASADAVADRRRSLFTLTLCTTANHTIRKDASYPQPFQSNSNLSDSFFLL